MDTGDRELVFSVEGNKTWGIGYRPGDAAKYRDSWGQNLFGKALMEVRSTCRNYLRHRVTLGHMPSCPQEVMYRRALKDGKLSVAEDGKLSVVLNACSTSEINVLSRMAVATRDPQQFPQVARFLVSIKTDFDIYTKAPPAYYRIE
jgi:hypothetical protein